MISTNGTNFIGLRITPKEKELIASLADSEGISISKWIKNAIRERYGQNDKFGGKRKNTSATPEELF
jgi:hypothetical protein